MTDALTAPAVTPDATRHGLRGVSASPGVGSDDLARHGRPRDSRHRSGAGPPAGADRPIEPLPSPSVTRPSLAASWSR